MDLTLDISVHRDDEGVCGISYRPQGADARSFGWDVLTDAFNAVREACAKGSPDALPFLRSALPLGITDDGWVVLYD